MSTNLSDVNGAMAETLSRRFPAPMTISVSAASIILILIALASCSRYEVYLGERVGAQDDYIWLYMTSAKIGDLARGDRLLHELNAVGDGVVHRLRSDYEQNYLGMSAVYRGA